MNTRYFKWVPVVDGQLCTGCAACLEACGPKSLELVDRVAVLTQPESCGSEERCIASCPTAGIRMEWMELAGDKSCGKWRAEVDFSTAPAVRHPKTTHGVLSRKRRAVLKTTAAVVGLTILLKGLSVTSYTLASAGAECSAPWLVSGGGGGVNSANAAVKPLMSLITSPTRQSMSAARCSGKRLTNLEKLNCNVHRASRPP